MGYNAKWHIFPFELPPNDGRYITCDTHNNMQICVFMKEVPRCYRTLSGSRIEGEKLTNVFLWSRANTGRNVQVRKNVSFWTDIPELPDEINTTFKDIKMLEERIKELQDKIKQLENVPESNTDNH